jgi:glycolate oxidase FAD binding subunit
MPLLDPALTDVRERICAAAADRTPLRILGGGSKDFYGWHAHTGAPLTGTVLDTSALRGIVSYEPSELVVTVRAGTPLAELEAVLAEQGQCLPFEPPHFAWSADGASAGRKATVGGMVASGLAGPARASVGGVRDYVLGVQMVNGRGEHLTFGGQVMKNVAGYDVSRLMVGAMGTLGVLTDISLKVLPLAPAEATLVFELNQADALEQLHRWGGQPLPLNASCWVHDASGAAPGKGRDLLFVRLRGAVAAVEAACTHMLAQQPGMRMDNAQAKPDWALCRDQRLPFFTNRPAPHCALWRLSVPPTAPVFDLPWAQLVEWHGGLRWLWAPLDAASTLHIMARSHGGNATVFIAAHAHPAGVKGLFDSQNSAQTAIQRRLQASFDPHGIFNPGRLFDAA